MGKLSGDESAHLVTAFARWAHPAVRDPSRAAIVGSGDPIATAEVLELLIWLVVDAPVPTGAEPDFERLGERMLGAVAELLRTLPLQRARREELAQQLVMTLEPFCMKVLAVLSAAVFAKAREKKRGLGAVIAMLQSESRIPYRLSLSSEDFERTEGWDARTSYENAVRDVMPARLDAAHRAKAPTDHLWMSAFAFVLGIVDVCAKDLAAARSAALNESNGALPGRPAFVGMPVHRRIDLDAAEPMTTRAPAAAKWRRHLEEDARETGRVVVVEGTPGWGKSMFLALALGEVKRSVHFVDASMCSTEHALAEALLVAIDVEDEDRAAIDRSPVAAVRVLSRLLVPPAIVVLENLHRTVAGEPAKGLGQFVRALHAFGHLVVLESWTRDLECLCNIPQGKLRRCAADDLPRLSPDEIAEWGRRLLRRELASREREAIELFEGHPLATRGALDMLRVRYPEPSPGAEHDLLEACFEWHALQESFTAVVARHVAGTRPSSSSEATAVVSDELGAWFGVLPFAMPDGDDTGEHVRRALHRLRTIGLVDVTDGRWRTQTWARIIGTQRCFDAPDMIAANEPWLAGLARQVPPDARNRQRRHLLVLATSLPHARDPLLRILAAVPEPTSTAEAEADDYSAPAAPEVVAAALDSSPGADVGDAPAPALPPPDIFFWLLEAAGRHGNEELVRHHLERLQASRGDSESAQVIELARDWAVVRAVHRAIAQLASSRRRLWPLYAIAVELLPADLSACEHGAAYRGWAARLLTSAGECARASGDADAADRCLARAQAALHGASPPPGDTFARYLHDDIAYRIVAARAAAGRSLTELLEAHEVALRAIPPHSRWSPDRVVRWSHRELRHLRVLLSARRDDELITRVLDALTRLPVDERWFRIVQEIRARSSEPLARKVERLALRRLGELDRVVGRSALTLSRLARLLLDPEASRRHALEWGLEAASEHAARGEEEDLALATRALLVLSRARSSPNPLEGSEKLAETLLAALGERANAATTCARARSICLATLAQELMSKRIEVPGEKDPFDLTRAKLQLQTASRRINAMYRTHVTLSSAWLWDDWAEWKIDLCRRANTLERQRVAPNLQGTAQARELVDFVACCDAAIPGHPATHAVAVRIYRYLWDWNAVRARIPLLLEQKGDFRERSRNVDIVADALSAIALAPPLFRAHDRQLDERDTTLLEEVLGERTLAAPSRGAQLWAELTRLALRRASDQVYWEEVIDAGRRLFGRPEDYWNRIVEYAQPSCRRRVMSSRTSRTSTCSSRRPASSAAVPGRRRSDRISASRSPNSRSPHRLPPTCGSDRSRVAATSSRAGTSASRSASACSPRPMASCSGPIALPKSPAGKAAR